MSKQRGKNFDVAFWLGISFKTQDFEQTQHVLTLDGILCYALLMRKKSLHKNDLSHKPLFR